MRILIADGDETGRDAVQSILEGLGHQCSVVDNGPAAWDVLRHKGVDVVVAEARLPGLGAVELCQRARRDPDISYSYFIVRRRAGDGHDLIAATNAGVDDHLAEAPTGEELQASLLVGARVSALHLDLSARHRALAYANQDLLDTRVALEVANARLYELSHRDPITGLSNRLRMSEDIAGIQSRLERYGHRFSIVMCDIDRFKVYNDVHGHRAGDRLLAEVGRAIIAESRPGDSAYRYGGDEFLIVYPDQTIATATIAIERLRRRIAQVASSGNLPGSITLSAGIAEAGTSDRFENVAGRADHALHSAKHAGRNHVAAAPDPEPLTPTPPRPYRLTALPAPPAPPPPAPPALEAPAAGPERH